MVGEQFQKKCNQLIGSKSVQVPYNAENIRVFVLQSPNRSTREEYDAIL